jgi:L-ascorbate metabolism protein UlaG (beta-lactamase superfamily)
VKSMPAVTERPLAMPHGASVHLGLRQTRFLQGLRGFIGEVAAAIARAVPLEEAVEQAAAKHPDAAAAFELRRGRLAERFGLKERYLFPRADPVDSIAFVSQTHRKRVRLPVEDQRALPAMARLIHRCASGAFSRREIHAQVAPSLAGLLEALEENGLLSEVPEQVAPPLPEVPCVVRLQHAGLLFRTARAGVLVDPHFNSTYEPAELRRNIPRAAFEGRVDAILISHSHEDHFNPASLATFDRDTPIVVPKVPRASILCPDMKRRLESMGFRDVRTPAWGSRPLRFGDVEVNVLPFYGEQPLVHEPPRSPELRNWGNTYLVRTEAFRAWFLIDSGADATGGMDEVARHVRERFGGVDLLLSNLRRFGEGSGSANPFYISPGGQYWLALTPDQMRRFPSMKACLTLGPDGVAEICRITRARYFLPYAHWWSEPGTVDPDEPAALAALVRHLGRSRTKVLQWSVGDACVPGTRGRFERRPWFV